MRTLRHYFFLLRGGKKTHTKPTCVHNFTKASCFHLCVVERVAALPAPQRVRRLSVLWVSSP